jgi:Tfp pilus assembly PilM family ATPase
LKVLRDDEMLYDRDQAFGGSQLTQLISRQYGFSYEEAEQKKLAADLPTTTRPRCSRRSSTACRRKSAGRCSISSPARRITRCTT